MKYSKLSIIVPVYNEKSTIREILMRINNVSLKKYDLKKEIIIVDDYSTDGTYKILKEIKNKSINLIRHKKNMGKGAAIRTALNHVKGDIIIIQDADTEYEPKEYVQLIDPIIKNRAKVVYGSRILKKGNRKHSALSFYIGGLFITWFTNLLYNTRITDEPTCYKVFRTDILKDVKLKCEGFEFCPEVTAKIAKKGIDIHEVPISYYPRTKKQGKKIRFRDGLEAIWCLLKYRFVD